MRLTHNVTVLYFTNLFLLPVNIYLKKCDIGWQSYEIPSPKFKHQYFPFGKEVDKWCQTMSFWQIPTLYLDVDLMAGVNKKCTKNNSFLQKFCSTLTSCSIRKLRGAIYIRTVVFLSKETFKLRSVVKVMSIFSRCTFVFNKKFNECKKKLEKLNSKDKWGKCMHKHSICKWHRSTYLLSGSEYNIFWTNYFFAAFLGLFWTYIPVISLHSSWSFFLQKLEIIGVHKTAQ